MNNSSDFTLGSEEEFAAIVDSVCESEPKINLGSLDLVENVAAPVTENAPVSKSSSVKSDFTPFDRLCGGIEPAHGHGGFSMFVGNGFFRS